MVVQKITQVDKVKKKEREIGYKSVIDFGRDPPVYYPHTIGEYPTKIFPGTATIMIKRFTSEGDTILDPFCGCGTFAVEAKLTGRNSINYDINPVAVELTKKKLAALDELAKQTKLDGDASDNTAFAGLARKTTHIVELRDARELPLKNESVDAVITDIPYANMIRYSDLENDLSTIEDYDTFLTEITKAFSEIKRVLKEGKYCVVFVCDYRVGAARKILPIHSDVIQIMTRVLGFVLFDIYIWRYYRSGGFRPFGKRPYQAMNLHSYILVFYKPKKDEDLDRKNRPIRYRRRLLEKQNKVKTTILSKQG